jgi:hypothetical protein
VKPLRNRFAMALVSLTMLLGQNVVQAGVADKVSDVRATKHNLSAVADGTATRTGTVPVRTIKASTETQVCVFCHTPHGATTGVAPLWNRQLSNATYTASSGTYTSTSMEANATELANGPGGSSKLCLSCHDGTMAIDKVNVLNGASNPPTKMIVGSTSGTNVTMPAGSGATTGFTRNLGTNMGNDHPISFTYNSTLATNDGELRGPDGTVVGNRVRGASPKVKMPLENDQVQCATCHDPHMYDKIDPKAKFLRMNRLQAEQPVGGAFNQTNDIICLACHNKAGTATGNSWAYSAHANKQVASQTYITSAANQREFPAGTKVWQAACLNCHDTHTVEGARRLLREGTDSGASPKTGGKPALEETCYQCHTTSATSAVTINSDGTVSADNGVPNIKTDFTTAGNKHMPIATSDQANNFNATEVHEIGGNFNDSTLANCNNTSATSTGNCGKDLLESRAKLGVGNLNNRHAECTDCHNPHRVVKFRDFRGVVSGTAGSITGTPDAAGTHPHVDSTMSHTNIASGVLRGSWGVEPTTYPSTSFHEMPSAFTVKRGDPGTSGLADVGQTFVTREYQICLKCHSNYGYTDNNVYPIGNRPTLTSFTGGTTSGTNGLTMFTNQAKEFQAPSTHAVEAAGVTGSGAGSAYQGATQYNHRSWHPVMAATGRGLTERGISNGNPWLAPWNSTVSSVNQVGKNTMYCSDCHGSNTTNASVIPTGGDSGSPWGPHGSSNNFILKGTWSSSTGTTTNTTELCFKCHNSSIYRSTSESGDGTSGQSGFSGPKANNLHGLHGNRVGSKNGTMKCTWCHIAVPHGWKNKAFLVNLNDIGEEAGHGTLGSGTSREVATSGSNNVYNKQPYYLNAKLKVVTFAQSNKWSDTNCGSSGKAGANLITNDGRVINSAATTADSGANGTSNTTGTGKNWMTSTCSSPP